MSEEGGWSLRVGVCFHSCEGGVAGKTYAKWHPGVSLWPLTSCSYIPALTRPQAALQSEGSANN